MARVNVEQKALTDPRFGELGLMLLADFPEIGPDIAQPLGLGRMVSVWNACQEAETYTLTDNNLIVLLGNRKAAQFLIDCGLGKRVRRGVVHIAGTEGRVEWLGEKRRNGKETGKLGAQFGKLGGRPKKPADPVTGNPVETRSTGSAETPLLAPAPAPDSKNQKQSQNPVPSEPKNNARALVENFTVDDSIRAFAKQHGQDADQLLPEWLDHNRTVGYRTRSGPVKDAAASFRTWIRKADEFAGSSGSGSGARKSAPSHRRIVPVPLERE